MNDAIQDAMPELSRWIGRKRVIEDEIGLTAVRRIAGMLDLPPEDFAVGTVLPPHWFGMFFADIARQSQIGPDGHPDKGVFLPPIPLPRRMGAGRRVKIMGRLRAGHPARRIAEVAAIEPKSGRSGNIVVLTMRHTFEAEGKTIAVDEFDAIYREAVKPGEKTTSTQPAAAPGDPAWSESKTLTSPLVFRYSAVTWNAHRIHYDADYARSEEGYPNTVQNGGLTMQLMIDAALRHTKRELLGFTARLSYPISVGETVQFCGRAATDTGMSVWVANANGNLCGQTELELAP